MVSDAGSFFRFSCVFRQVYILLPSFSREEREKGRERAREEESANKLSSRSIRNDVSIGPGQTGNKFLRGPNRSTWICSALINRNPGNEAVENPCNGKRHVDRAAADNLIGLKKLHLKQLHADTCPLLYFIIDIKETKIIISISLLSNFHHFDFVI